MRDGELWVWTNDEHINFRLAKAALDTPGEWETVIALLLAAVRPQPSPTTGDPS